jgi:hypothetical protein
MPSNRYQRLEIDENMTDLESFPNELSGDRHNRFSYQKSLEPTDENRTPGPHSGSGSLYYYTPIKMVPKLRLFDGKSLNSSLKAILRKKTLLMIDSHASGDPTDRWNYLITGEVEGWCQFNLNDENIQEAIRPLTRYRRYLEWKGINFFFFDGKIMFGSDFKFFLGTNILFLIPSFFYLLLIVPVMYQPILTGVVMLCLFLYSLINLWLAAITEPGIIPRNPSHITVSFYFLLPTILSLTLTCLSVACPTSRGSQRSTWIQIM